MIITLPSSEFEMSIIGEPNFSLVYWVPRASVTFIHGKKGEIIGISKVKIFLEFGGNKIRISLLTYKMYMLMNQGPCCRIICGHIFHPLVVVSYIFCCSSFLRLVCCSSTSIVFTMLWAFLGDSILKGIERY